MLTRRALLASASASLLAGPALAQSYPTQTIRIIAGWGLIAVAVSMLLIREWRSQRAISRLEFDQPSLGFVQSTIDRLREQRDLHRRYYLPFMAAVVVGMNLTLPATNRFWMRLLVSALPFVAFEFGLWLRRKRFDLECRPLIDQLSAMRSALEERVD